MKKTYFILVLLAMGITCTAQVVSSLSLDSCYILSKQQFPLIKQRGLIERSKDYSVKNIAKGYLPQFVMNGQATYQSAVTQIPIEIKGLTIPTLSKDQYKIYAELDQTIFDGGLIKNQKEVQKANSEIQQQNLEVQLYALRDRVNQLYFGILLLNEQLNQNSLLQKDIESSIDKITVALNNGAAMKTTLTELQTELLQQQQNRITLEASRKAYDDMLSLLIARNLNDKTVFQKPGELILDDDIKRPELLYFASQKKSYDIQNNLLNSSNMPKLQFFFQGGYGRPTLNLLQNEFATYYIGGLRLNWSLSGLYSLQNDRRLLGINKQMIDTQKETFIFNTRISQKQQNAAILQLKDLMDKDHEIVMKRTEIKEASKAQLEKGMITVHEYISQLNAEDLAKQSFLIHQVQWMMAQYNYQNITGN